MKHNSYAIYCKKYEKKKHISEVQKYTEEYLSVLFTFFLHCNCWGIIQHPEQTSIKFISVIDQPDAKKILDLK